MTHKRFLSSFGFAWAGVRRAFVQQPNFRIELLLGALALALAVWLRAPLAPILIVIGLVLALELVNSAVEAIVDLVSPAPHELAGAAKDLSAAAVLLASVAALAVGLVVLGPPLWQRLSMLGQPIG